MRELKSTQRRRRLRIIKAKDARSEERIRSAASTLTSVSTTHRSRVETEQSRQQLMTECGAPPSVQVRVLHPESAEVTLPLHRPQLLIGTDANCDLRLGDNSVQPHHAVLQWIEGRLFYCDISQRELTDRTPKPNGYWIDSQPIKIGPYTLILEGYQPGATTPSSPLDRSDPLLSIVPQLGLQFIGVEQNDNRWPINRQLTMIGRGSQCKLRLNHPSMPNVQAGLLRTPQNCWLFDIAGTGSTGINGRVIRLAPIDVGDILYLGPFRVEVVVMAFEPLKTVHPIPPAHVPTSPGNVKLFAPGPADLKLRNGTSTRSTKPPAKSAALTDSTDTNAAITEIVTRNPSTRTQKRHVPKTTILGPSTVGATASVEVSAPTPDISAADSFVRPHSRSTGRPNTDIGTEPNRLAIADTPPASEPMIPINPAPNALNVAEFVELCEHQLVELTASLDQLKQICQKPSRRSVSKRFKSRIDSAIQQTLQSRDGLQELLNQAQKSPRRH